jgi:hypothetical protein
VLRAGDGLNQPFTGYMILQFFFVMQKDWTQKTIDEGMHLPFVLLAYAAVGSFLVLMSSCLVLLWAPAAAGGGVS